MANINRKTAIIILVLAFLFVSGIVTVRLQITGGTPALGTSGSKILDSSGKRVFLRGVNWGAMADETGGGFSNDAAALDGAFKGMTKFKINCIRIMIVQDWWTQNFRGQINWSPTSVTDQPNTNRPYFRDTLNTILSVANDNGIYVVVSVWTADYDTYSKRAEVPFPTTLLPDATAFQNWWLDFVTAYASFPNLIIEYYNEPGTPSQAPAFMDGAKATTQALRSQGFNNLVLCQWGYAYGFNWNVNGGSLVSHDASWFDQYESRMSGISNVMFGTHLYPGSYGSSSGLTDAAAIKDYLLNNLDYKSAIESGFPIFIGEIGSHAGNSQEYTLFDTWLKTLNEWDMNYLAFSWGSLTTNTIWTLWTGTPSNPSLTATGALLYQAILNGYPSTSGTGQGKLGVSSVDQDGNEVHATVQVNGEKYASPFEISLPPGNYTVTAKYDNQTLTQEAIVTSGQTSTIKFDVQNPQGSPQPQPTGILDRIAQVFRDIIDFIKRWFGG